MPVKKGQHLGSIRNLEDLRLRCVCKAEDDCWHLRSPSGKPMPFTGAVQTVCLFGIGQRSATRAAWMLTGKEVFPWMVVYRTCDSYDCVNPKHLRQGPRSSVARKAAADGKFGSPEQLAPLRKQSALQRKTTPEMVRLIVESPLPAEQLAKALPICVARVRAIRREGARRPSSVFSWRPGA